MTNYQDEVVQDQRLRILQLLKDAPEYTRPEPTLGEMLGQRYGHWLSIDRLAAETAWLDENGLIVRRAVGLSAILILTKRGLDVARDRAHIPGVARPWPGE